MTVDSVVIDTNVLISAVLSRGSPPAQVVRHWLAHGRLLFSDATFDELATRLWRPKFDRYLSIEDRKLLLHDLGAVGVWMKVPEDIAVRRFSRDPDDDKFLHVALAGGARWLISGDRDLLDLPAMATPEILSPAQAMERLTG